MAPISLLLDSMSSGYDPHYFAVRTSPQGPLLGLAAFNVDTMLQKQTQKMVKVNLYHVSSVDPSKFDEVLSLAMDYIWKYMHCATIRISLYHYETEGKLQVNADLKTKLKSKGFKWKTVTNEVKSGQRVEIMECPNTTHKDQLDPSLCVIYREGLKREDFHKEPFSLKIATTTLIGNPSTHHPH